MNFEMYAKEAVQGIIQANLPELVGSIGAFVTFRDKAYAMEVAIDQITASALSSSITGAIVGVGSRLIQSGAIRAPSGNGNRPRRKKNRKRKNR